MGKMRDLFKKIGATKVTVHTKMETIKDKNDKDLKKQKRLRKVARIHKRTIQKRS